MGRGHLQSLFQATLVHHFQDLFVHDQLEAQRFGGGAQRSIIFPRTESPTHEDDLDPVSGFQEGILDLPFVIPRRRNGNDLMALIRECPCHKNCIGIQFFPAGQFISNGDYFHFQNGPLHQR